MTKSTPLIPRCISAATLLTNLSDYIRALRRTVASLSSTQLPQIENNQQVSNAESVQLSQNNPSLAPKDTALLRQLVFWLQLNAIRYNEHTLSMQQMNSGQAPAIRTIGSRYKNSSQPEFALVSTKMSPPQISPLISPSTRQSLLFCHEVVQLETLSTERAKLLTETIVQISFYIEQLTGNTLMIWPYGSIPAGISGSLADIDLKLIPNPDPSQAIFQHSSFRQITTKQLSTTTQNQSTLGNDTQNSNGDNKIIGPNPNPNANSIFLNPNIPLLPKGDYPTTLWWLKRIAFYPTNLEYYLSGSQVVSRVLYKGVRVPIVTLLTADKVNVDLTFTSDDSAAKSALFRAYIRYNPFVQPLILLVKQWAKARCIGDASVHYMNSFSWSLLVICFLQIKGIIPVVHAHGDRNPHMVLGNLDADVLDGETVGEAIQRYNQVKQNVIGAKFILKNSSKSVVPPVQQSNIGIFSSNIEPIPCIEEVGKSELHAIDWSWFSNFSHQEISKQKSQKPDSPTPTPISPPLPPYPTHDVHLPHTSPHPHTNPSPHTDSPIHTHPPPLQPSQGNIPLGSAYPWSQITPYFQQNFNPQQQQQQQQQPQEPLQFPNFYSPTQLTQLQPSTQPHQQFSPLPQQQPQLLNDPHHLDLQKQYFAQQLQWLTQEQQYYHQLHLQAQMYTQQIQSTLSPPPQQQQQQTQQVLTPPPPPPPLQSKPQYQQKTFNQMHTVSSTTTPLQKETTTALPDPSIASTFTVPPPPMVTSPLNSIPSLMTATPPVSNFLPNGSFKPPPQQQTYQHSFDPLQYPSHFVQNGGGVNPNPLFNFPSTQIPNLMPNISTPFNPNLIYPNWPNGPLNPTPTPSNYLGRPNDGPFPPPPALPTSPSHHQPSTAPSLSLSLSTANPPQIIAHPFPHFTALVGNANTDVFLKYCRYDPTGDKLVSVNQQDNNHRFELLTPQVLDGMRNQYNAAKKRKTGNLPNNPLLIQTASTPRKNDSDDFPVSDQLEYQRRATIYKVETPPSLPPYAPNGDLTFWAQLKLLLFEFFYFYSFIFDPKLHAVSVRNGRLVWLSEYENLLRKLGVESVRVKKKSTASSGISNSNPLPTTPTLPDQIGTKNDNLDDDMPPDDLPPDDDDTDNDNDDVSGGGGSDDDKCSFNPPLWIEDPFSPIDNTARSVAPNQLSLIKFELRRAAILGMYNVPLHTIFTPLNTDMFSLSQIFAVTDSETLLSRGVDRPKPIPKMPLLGRMIIESSRLVKMTRYMDNLSQEWNNIYSIDVKCLTDGHNVNPKADRATSRTKTQDKSQQQSKPAFNPLDPTTISNNPQLLQFHALCSVHTALPKLLLDIPMKTLIHAFIDEIHSA